jgi:hypothetical protein
MRFGVVRTILDLLIIVLIVLCIIQYLKNKYE